MKEKGDNLSEIDRQKRMRGKISFYFNFFKNQELRRQIAMKFKRKSFFLNVLEREKANRRPFITFEMLIQSFESKGLNAKL